MFTFEKLETRERMETISSHSGCFLAISKSIKKRLISALVRIVCPPFNRKLAVHLLHPESSLFCMLLQCRGPWQQGLWIHPKLPTPCWDVMKCPDLSRQQEVLHGQRAVSVKIPSLIDICLKYSTPLLMMIEDNSSMRSVQSAGHHTYIN